MNVGGSSSSYTNRPGSNTRFSGLASGIDTDAMVEAMLANTQAKIDKQNALKQQTLWKQEIFRDVISRINSFQNKFTSVATGLRNASMYNTMKAISSSNAIKVSAQSGVPAGRTTIEVKQKATASVVQSQMASTGKINTKIDASALERKVTLEVDGSEVEVDLKGAATNDEVTQRLNNALASKGVNAEIDENGVLTLSGTDGNANKEIRVSGKSSDLGLKMLGLGRGAKSTMTYEKDSGGVITNSIAKLSSRVDLQAKASVNVTFDGVTKSITLADDDIEGSFKKGLEQFGKGQIVLTNEADGSFSLSASKGRTLRVGGSSAGLKALGLKDGVSNTLNGASKLKDLNLGTALQGDSYTFTINGKEITASGDTTLNGLISKINSSGAGVTASYSLYDDTFTIKSNQLGAGFGVEMEQSEGNLLSAMFGVESADTVSSGKLTKNSISGNPLSGGSYESGSAFNFKVDGKQYSIVIPERFELDNKGEPVVDADGNKVAKPYTAQEVTKYIDQALETTFGYTENGSRALEIDSSGNFKVNNGATVEFAQAQADASPDSNAKNLALQFGFSNTSGVTTTLADANTTLAELGLDGLNGLNGSTKLSELSGNLSYIDGKIQYKGSGDNQALSGGHMEKLFGTDTINFSSTTGLSVATETAGLNSIVVIDGVETERSGNSINYNGLNITINDAKPGEVINIDVEQDTSQLFDTIKSFVEEYNTLLEDLNELVGEDASYKKYDPLTDAQKKEMTENEIKLWEEKAKEGLLRRDSNIASLISDMRTNMYTKPSGSLYTLFNIGIETSDKYEDKGKLVIKDETRLKNLIDMDPEGLMDLFRGNGKDGSGLIGQLNTVLDKAAKTSSASPGTLVAFAGAKNSGTYGSNRLSKKIDEYDKKIKNLMVSYELQKTRYWKQFTAMERVVSQMNSQSSWLGQQFA